MKRTTFLIDNYKGFSKMVKNKKTLDSLEHFKVYYTLDKDEYGILNLLEDMDGNVLNINDVRGCDWVYLHECMEAYRSNRGISDEYKDFIEILDVPRERKNYDDCKKTDKRK